MSCYDHSGMRNIQYLVRVFTKAQYSLYRGFAHLAHLGLWVIPVMSKYELI